MADLAERCRAAAESAGLDDRFTMRLTDLDASALSRAIHDRELSCREVMRACRAHIEAVNPAVNAIVNLRVPAGFGDAGLPIGLQLIGPPQADLAVLRLAHAYELAAQSVIGVRPEAAWA